ncbi:MAG: hypothetical protein HPZ91_06020 [Lentisphaeria bacterium]|nr:hypothetical protein [Lentisphaeria bacterium]
MTRQWIATTCMPIVQRSFCEVSGLASPCRNGGATVVLPFIYLPSA